MGTYDEDRMTQISRCLHAAAKAYDSIWEIGWPKEYERLAEKAMWAAKDLHMELDNEYRRLCDDAHRAHATGAKL